MSCVLRVIGAPSSRRRLALVLPVLLTMLLLAAAPARVSAADRHRHPAPHRQRLTLEVLPPVAQVGRLPAAPDAAATVLSARLRPAVSQQRVRLQRHTGHGWVTVDRARTDHDGWVSFTAPRLLRGHGVTYRATTSARPGYRADASPAVRSTAWGAPAFDDQFSGTALGPAWENRIQFYNPYGGRSCSKGSPQAVAVSGGTLRLSVLADPDRAGETCPTEDAFGHVGNAAYTWRLNGHISTQHAFDFKYGVAAARIRFQQAQGQHGAFWLQPRGLLETAPTPWGAEIDTIEWYGDDGVRSRLATTVHRHLAGAADTTISVGGRLTDPNRYLESRRDRWWRNYHVFSVEWTPEEYVFRIDGQVTMRTRANVSHHPEFLILSMLSSDFELGRIRDDALPQHMDVDWVRVWSHHHS
jgi:beta-glucanase (GH16 family)